MINMVPHFQVRSHIASFDPKLRKSENQATWLRKVTVTAGPGVFWGSLVFIQIYVYIWRVYLYILYDYIDITWYKYNYDIYIYIHVWLYMYTVYIHIYIYIYWRIIRNNDPTRISRCAVCLRCLRSVIATTAPWRRARHSPLTPSQLCCSWLLYAFFKHSIVI